MQTICCVDPNTHASIGSRKHILLRRFPSQRSADFRCGSRSLESEFGRQQRLLRDRVVHLCHFLPGAARMDVSHLGWACSDQRGPGGCLHDAVCAGDPSAGEQKATSFGKSRISHPEKSITFLRSMLLFGFWYTQIGGPLMNERFHDSQFICKWTSTAPHFGAMLRTQSKSFNWSEI